MTDEDKMEIQGLKRELAIADPKQFKAVVIDLLTEVVLRVRNIEARLSFPIETKGKKGKKTARTDGLV